MDQVRALHNAVIDSSNRLHCITVDQGRIASVELQTAPRSMNREFWQGDSAELNLDGRVLLPGLAEHHAHIDKSYCSVANATGTLRGAIDAMAQYKQNRSLQEVRDKARRSLLNAIEHGVTYLRTHVDLGSEKDLASLHMILELKQEFAKALNLQITALGQTQDARGVELMAQALRAGADFVGGAPALSESPFSALDNAYALAQAAGSGLDLHIDETEDPQSRCLQKLTELCLQQPLSKPVFASHCCALAFQDSDERDALAHRLVRAGIELITLPSSNLMLMGRGAQPKPRGALPVQELLEKGVHICVGGDNVQDSFNPFGRYDPLLNAYINAHVAQLSTAEQWQTALNMVLRPVSYSDGWPTTGIAQRHKLAPGQSADFCILNCTDYFDAVRTVPTRLSTIFRGRMIVALNQQRHWHWPDQLGSDENGT